MKNKYLTKYFCITMISAAVLATPAFVLGAETGAESSKQHGETAEISSGLTPASVSSDSESADAAASADGTTDTASASTADPTAAPTPEPEASAVEPTSAPAAAEPTAVPTEAASTTTAEPTAAPTEAAATPTAAPTAAPADSTVTPTEIPDASEVTPTETPAEPTVTPTETPDAPEVTPTETPEDPAVTPTAVPTVTPTAVPETTKIPAKVQKIIDRIDALSLTEITISSEKEIKSVRKAYDALSDENKELVSNYTIFVNMEAELSEITQTDIFSSDDVTGIVEDSDVTAVEGTPVYVTNMVSNLHAGKDFYLNSLTDLYHLSFSDDFAAVMEEIEREYKAENNLSDASDDSGVTSSEDTYLVRNWQDILAVYVYRRSLEGEESFTLDASCKEELAEIFAELNPLIPDETDEGKLVYANYHINYYIKEHKIAKEDRKILKKYIETDCSLLCAVVTGARGFVRQSVGDDVSEERVNVITAAYSLIGKVGYFWGGKSTTLGEDSSWGNVMQVTASGSKSTGTLRAYGLDCSGFVTWAVINGYQDTGVQSAIGDGTTEQWLLAEVISEADAQPGDLVFEAGPEAGQDNHVGIICGKTDAGDWIVVHCSSSQNGVTVEEAYGAGFRYIRRPTVYDTAGSLLDADEESTVDTEFLDSMSVENPLAGLQGTVETEETGESEETAETDAEEFVGPVLMSADGDASDEETEENAVQTGQSPDEERVKQTLADITVENALVSLKTEQIQEEALPDVTAVNALKSLCGIRRSGTASTESVQTAVTADSVGTAETAETPASAETEQPKAAVQTVQRQSEIQTVSYAAAGGSGSTPVDGVRVTNALLSILR